MMTTHEVSTDFNGGMAFTSTINGHPVRMDTTTSDGGADGGPSPKRLMLASLAGCTGMDVVSLLEKMRVSFSDFKMDISAQLTDEHPKIYKKVELTYYIKVAEADQSKVEKAVSLSQEKYCGVSAMFRSFSDLQFKIVFS